MKHKNENVKLKLPSNSFYTPFVTLFIFLLYLYQILSLGCLIRSNYSKATLSLLIIFSLCLTLLYSYLVIIICAHHKVHVCLDSTVGERSLNQELKNTWCHTKFKWSVFEYLSEIELQKNAVYTYWNDFTIDASLQCYWPLMI